MSNAAGQKHAQMPDLNRIFADKTSDDVVSQVPEKELWKEMRLAEVGNNGPEKKHSRRQMSDVMIFR